MTKGHFNTTPTQARARAVIKFFEFMNSEEIKDYRDPTKKGLNKVAKETGHEWTSICRWVLSAMCDSRDEVRGELKSMMKDQGLKIRMRTLSVRSQN